jgi:hypothetical protein
MYMKNGKCTSLSDHQFVLCDMETGMGSVCTICGISSYEAVMAEECNMKNTPQDVDQARNQQLDQLKANAKAHKKHVDRLSAKIGALEVENENLKKNAKTEWSTLLFGAGVVYLSGFLLTLGFFSAVGWVGFIGGLLR